MGTVLFDTRRLPAGSRFLEMGYPVGRRMDDLLNFLRFSDNLIGGSWHQTGKAIYYDVSMGTVLFDTRARWKKGKKAIIKLVLAGSSEKERPYGLHNNVPNRTVPRDTGKNNNRMRRGAAPIGWDNHPVELHHWNGIANDFYNYSPVTARWWREWMAMT